MKKHLGFAFALTSLFSSFVVYSVSAESVKQQIPFALIRHHHHHFRHHHYYRDYARPFIPVPYYHEPSHLHNGREVIIGEAPRLHPPYAIERGYSKSHGHFGFEGPIRGHG